MYVLFILKELSHFKKLPIAARMLIASFALYSVASGILSRNGYDIQFIDNKYSKLVLFLIALKLITEKRVFKA